MPRKQMSLPTLRTQDRTKAPIPEQVDVAIIGAGLGGLSAGAHLAQAGFSVAVFDAHYVAGGYGTMFSRGPTSARFMFDVGLHYVGDCLAGGPIAGLLDPLGVDVTWEPLDPDGFDEIVLPEVSFRIPTDRGLYRDRLVGMFPAEVAGIDRYVRLLDEVAAVTRDQRVLEHVHRLIPHLARHGRLLAWHRNTTIGAFLGTSIRDANLRAILLGQSGDYGVAPSKASAVLHCGLANHYFRGAYYPRGGGQVIADGLASVLEAAGGQVLLRKPVVGIRVEGGRATGIDVDVGRDGTAFVQARRVISNADIKQTFLDLLPAASLPVGWKRRAEGWEMASALFMTFLGIRRDMGAYGMRAANIWAFDSNDTEAMYQGIADGDMTPRASYITSGSLKDPHTSGHAPAGHTSVEIMAMLPGAAHLWGRDVVSSQGRHDGKGEVYLERKAHAEEVLINRLASIFPGVKDDIVFTESATPATLARYTRSTDGSAYGLASIPNQLMGGRPGFRSPVEGLYLVGASTKTGHGVVGALSSGREAARVVAADAGRSL